MCGRFACTLQPDEISSLLKYRRSGELKEPRWVQASELSTKYTPSANIGPGSYTPVLTSCKNVYHESNEKEEMLITQMKWGLIPSWHKGSEESFKFNMINCRADTIQTKASFKGPLVSGQRCVVITEGFFEWVSIEGKKQPYFIKNKNGKLLTMAALYSKWVQPEKKDILFSYSIVTVSASESIKSIHDRMPAILETSDQIQQWLTLPASEAIHLLEQYNSLQWYPVSSLVNNVKNQSLECLKEIDLRSANSSPSKKIMEGWLKRKVKNKDTDEEKSKVGKWD